MSARPKAEEWVRTDEWAIRDDVERLGVDGAIRYNLELANQPGGDPCWQGITAEEMREAIGGVLPRMSVEDIRQRMGEEATTDEAETMVDLLDGRHPDTVGGAEWMQLVADAAGGNDE